MNHSPPAPPQPAAAYYRNKAAEARRIAGVTTRAIKERLVGLALDFDQQAVAIEAGRIEQPEEAE